MMFALRRPHSRRGSSLGFCPDPRRIPPLHPCL